MRIRLFLAGLALAVSAAAGFAQTPITLPPVTSSPPPVLAIPLAAPVAPAPVEFPAALPPAGPVAPPPVVYSNPSCGTPCAAPVAVAPARAKCDKRPGLLSRLAGRLAIGDGTANPVACGCRAAERTFIFGGCSQFFTPGRTCDGCQLEYGQGWRVRGDNCSGIGSYLNR